MPLSLATLAAAAAACIAAYGVPCKRSALTCCPPALLDIVAVPVRSVMWTVVVLEDALMWAIPQWSTAMKGGVDVSYANCVFSAMWDFSAIWQGLERCEELVARLYNL